MKIEEVRRALANSGVAFKEDREGFVLPKNKMGQILRLTGKQGGSWSLVDVRSGQAVSPSIRAKTVLRSLMMTRADLSVDFGDDFEKTYKCHECHKPGFQAHELIGHRCKECRAKRSRIVSKDPALAASPWMEEGQKVWKKHGALGVDGGVSFRPRKRKLEGAQASAELRKLKRLPTWKSG
jgi:DNA-directed RNA polymerase subunit RPC12/RpoP